MVRSLQWKPNATVAAVIEQDGQFLLVEEHTEDGVRLNQPAGHWEHGESLLDAVRRETLEETGYLFEPTALLGVYTCPRPNSDVVYLRFAFTGELRGHDSQRALDAGIIAARWVSADTLQADPARWRSPLVWQCIEDYLSGQRYPLTLIRAVPMA
jgi:8-oxo-dGTP pyrophosphatase MutT (NUDIX family)